MLISLFKKLKIITKKEIIMKINPQDYIGKAIFITATNTNVGKTFASEVF